jgi:hypothetical protein
MISREQLRFLKRVEVEDLIADRDADGGFVGVRALEYAVGEVLDGEVRVGGNFDEGFHD